MGTHARPRHGVDGIKGRHRGEPEPLIDLDLGATALKTGAVLATGTAIVAGGAGGAFAAPSHPAYSGATAADFAALRQCESGGDYSINTHNGFYGAYQFDLGTWESLGYSGLPSNAPPATQDAAAEKLYSERGWEPWPACSKKLGLGTVSTQALVANATTPARRTATQPSLVSRSVKSVHVAGGVPAFDGTALTTKLDDTKRTDVLVWQSRMVRRGWHLTVDGYFGPQTARIAQQFAAEKGITAPTGQVTKDVWEAAWTAPITPGP